MKILFVHQSMISFVEKDLDILKNNYTVRVLQFKNLFNIFECIKMVFWADITFSWFGKLHAFFTVLFSKILRKKSIVVAGGDDVAFVPEVKYGMFSFWWKKWCPLFVFKFADLILPVSKYNENETLINAKADKTKVKMLYHGFSGDIFIRNPEIKKENIILTVGSITLETITKKGLLSFVSSAKYLPDTKFIIAGPDKEGAAQILKNISTKNVIFLGGIYGDDLIKLFNRAKVYAQLSIHESFSCALAEAMLCECIPVISSKSALPEVAGDCGIYVEQLTPENTAKQLSYALNMPDNYGKKARERILNKFPLYKRRDNLISYIENL